MEQNRRSNVFWGGSELGIVSFVWERNWFGLITNELGLVVRKVFLQFSIECFLLRLGFRLTLLLVRERCALIGCYFADLRSSMLSN